MFDPASIIVGLIYLTILRRSWITFRESPANSLFQTLSLYIFIFTIRDVVFSHTSGHSANDAFSRWWLYGLLVALAITNRKRQEAQSSTKVMAGGRATLEPAFASRSARQPFERQRPAAF